LKYDAVLYDFDGTLADTVPMIVKTFQAAFQEVVGENKDEAFLLSTIGLPLWDAFSAYDSDTQKALFDAYQRYNALFLVTEVAEFPGIREGLESVRNLSVLQGIVTSKRQETADITIKQFGLDGFFDVCVYRDDTTVHKPNPEPIFRAMEMAQITDASRVLYVGDSVHDLRCANRAGVDSAAVLWTYMPKEELQAEKPTYWLKTLSDISCILTDSEL